MSLLCSKRTWKLFEAFRASWARRWYAAGSRSTCSASAPDMLCTCGKLLGTLAGLVGLLSLLPAVPAPQKKCLRLECSTPSYGMPRHVVAATAALHDSPSDGVCKD